MKFTTVFAVLAAAAATVGAVPADTNANRLARGFPPLPPTRRATPVNAAKRSSPSGSNCSTDSVLCCNSIQSASSPAAALILGLLGLVLDPTVIVALTCTPFSPISIGGSFCNGQLVCCADNNYNGLIAIGCAPINL